MILILAFGDWEPECSLARIEDEKKWLKLSIIGRLTNEVRFAVAKLCFVSIKHQILTQCRALQNLSLHNDAISRKAS